MHLKEILTNKIFLVLIFVFLYLVTRLPGLGMDVINPDAVNWHYRSEQFIVGLKTGQLEKTYQHYHPGVTLMWIAGVPVEVVRQLNPEERVYDNENFLMFHTVSKVSVVAVQLLLSILLMFVLDKALVLSQNKQTFLKSFFVVTLVSFEPFFLGNSRLYHLDVLLTMFLFTGLLLAYLSIKDFKWLYGISAGVFLGLSFLTKSIAIGGVLFALIFGVGVYLLNKNYKGALKYTVALLIPMLATVIILFPALWGDLFGVIINIFEEGERVGIRKGHNQIFFGQYSENPGVLFYAFVILIKMSPMILLGVLLFAFFKIKELLRFTKDATSKLNETVKVVFTNPNLEFFLFIFYLGYVLVMIYPTKKLDRYMLPLFPFFSLLAVQAYFKLVEISKSTTKVIVGLSLLFILLPILTLYPYYFPYTSPLFINSENANNIIVQKPFGVGMPELKEHIISKYSEEFGEYPKLGFLDIKPMRTIYKGSHVFDVRESGTKKYDILILALDENMPEEVADGKYTFEKEESIYINGLEYWQIYKKIGTEGIDDKSEKNQEN